MRQKPGPKPKFGVTASAQINIALPPEFVDYIAQQAIEAGYVNQGGTITDYARDLLIAAVMQRKAQNAQGGAADPYASKP